MAVNLILLVALAVIVLVVLAVLIGLALGRRRRPEPSAAPVSEPEPSTPAAQSPTPARIPRAAIIVNPTKFADVDAVRRQVSAECTKLGWAEPLWVETTVEDPGQGQARRALDEGVDLICPLGGDGTVRAVAEAVVHSGTPVGLLPGGTGNLLARNLKLVVGDLDVALRVALTGVDHPIDVGRVVFDVSGEDQDGRERVFLVMAGLGFDAAMMAGAPERLKARFGWLAYAVSGLRNFNGPRVKVTVTVDGQPPFTRRVHTLLAGNCGRLAGGIVLMPEAEVDDGWLDVVTISPKGVIGWATVAARVLSHRGHDRVEHIRCRELSARCDSPKEAQLDGDIVGQVRAIRTRIDPGALVVRMPAPSVDA